MSARRRLAPATLPVMAPRGGKRPGAGRPRTVGGEATKILHVAIAVPDDVDELAALVEDDGKANGEAEAVRYLIRESAKRRARRATRRP